MLLLLVGCSAAGDSSGESAQDAGGPSRSVKRSPNIVFILSDDLGFNDVGFHGSSQIPTPHIDEIARTGVILNNYRVQPVCSPTRATIMSGRHVIHTGTYQPFTQGTNLRLNLTYTLLPAYLKKLGYSTHMVGKWHLGQNELSALPTSRGFDTYFGFWSGAEDYYSHDCRNAYDLADGTRTAFEWNGTYSTFLWNSKAVEVIEKADPSKPFFLYLAYQNVHWPLEAPQRYLDMFQHTTGGNKQRQAVCAMVAIMDESVGNLTAALKRKGVFEDTLLIFSSDNGGPTNGFEGTWSSNYPMRGGKYTLWEGGTRVVGAVRGPGLAPALAGTVSNLKIHATDWLPTLVHAASGDSHWFRNNMPSNEPPLLLGDGQDIWDSLRFGRAVREEFILECHPHDQDLHGSALVQGDWKLLKIGIVHGQNQEGWYAPPGQDPKTTSYQLPCDIARQPAAPTPFQCQADFCLFNVTADPCEYNDLATQHPDVVKALVARLREYQATAVPIVKGEGCDPVVVEGAWRPCDAPHPDRFVTEMVV